MINLLHYHYFNEIITSKQNFYSPVHWNLCLSSQLVNCFGGGLFVCFILNKKFKFKEYLWNYLKNIYIPHNWISDFSHVNHHKTPFCDDISELNTDYSVSDTIWTMFAPSKHYQLFFSLECCGCVNKKALFQGVTHPLFYICPQISKSPRAAAGTYWYRVWLGLAGCATSHW